ncbi:hypothetical protein LEN26_001249 [Aphanomyces euteiches]|nr:hypothetical protein AeMF1_019867 [Aphanomyces euteiches]KAH9161805.1 hypothetical protein LEN26_001249 [Aphanomyces euteiches]KAH9187668.1 hypothetical protein AeNC1_010355 [Aphanomyces euteiches]
MQTKASTATTTPMTEDALEAIKLKRRQYFREKQREHRSRERFEEQFLSKRLAELEEILRQTRTKLPQLPQRTSDGMLSWEDVAIALRDERDDSISLNRMLKVQSFAGKKLVEDMQRWIALANARPTHTPLRSSWRNVTLFSNPESRALGKEWITKQLYHNTDSIFERHGHVYPRIDSSSRFLDVDIEFSEGCYYFVFCYQYVHAQPPAAICERYKQNLCAMLMSDGLDPVLSSTLKELSGATAQHQYASKKGEAINLVYGEFHSEDHSVLVAQGIHDDECWRTDMKQRDISWWCHVQPTAEHGGTLVKSVLRFSQCFTRDGFMSLDEEATAYGLDLSQCPPHLKEDRFRNHVLCILKQQRDRFFSAKRLVE